MPNPLALLMTDSLEKEECRVGGIFLRGDFEVLIDCGHSEQNARATPDCAHEVSNNGQCSDAHATEGRSGGDVSVKLPLQGRITVARNVHLLVTKLLCQSRADEPETSIHVFEKRAQAERMNTR